MQYRKFGRLDWKVSALGFGCMRLPTNDGNPVSGDINGPESVRMIRHAIDSGVNYVDTAYMYHAGNSERVVAKALKDGYREKVKLATKSPVWMITKASDFDRILDDQLKKLETDHIDMYLLHAMDIDKWNGTVLKHGILERMVAARDAGKIKHLGFSFHDDLTAFKTIIDGFDRWDFCQIQYNYMDIENQAGTAGLRYAASKGLAVIIMEPLLGGRLANPPAPIRKMFDAEGKGRTPVDWALQWLWDQPEVSVLLSGMGAMPQVEGNLRSADASTVGSLKPEEKKFIERIRKIYQEKTPIQCTKCGYCMPCPNGVDIPRNFELYNGGFIHEDPKTSRGLYTRFMAEDERASHCAECRACEEKCPQKLEISELLKKVHRVLGEGQDYS